MEDYQYQLDMTDRANQQKKSAAVTSDGYNQNSNSKIQIQKQAKKNNEDKWKSMEKKGKAQIETIASAAKSSVNEGAIFTSEITQGYESVISTPPGLISIKNTSIGSVTYSSGLTEPTIFPSNYTSISNIATGETKNSLKLGIFGSSINTTFDEGTEIGFGPLAVGVTDKMEYGTISMNCSDGFTATGGLGLKANGDVEVIGKMEFNIAGYTLSNTTEASTNPKDLINVAAGFALNPYEKVMKKMKTDAGKLVAAGSVVAGVVTYGVATQGDKIASAIKSAGDLLTKPINLLGNGGLMSFSVCIPEETLNAMLTGYNFKAPSNGIASADINPDGTINM